MEKNKKIEDLRRKLWCDVAVAYVRNSNVIHKEFAAEWADQILEDFDNRFKLKN